MRGLLLSLQVQVLGAFEVTAKAQIGHSMNELNPMVSLINVVRQGHYQLISNQIVGSLKEQVSLCCMLAAR